jgi:hypothetical protein
VAAREAAAIRYTFTDVNSGDLYEVVVSTATGAIAKVTVGRSAIVFTP